MRLPTLSAYLSTTSIHLVSAERPILYVTAPSRSDWAQGSPQPSVASTLHNRDLSTSCTWDAASSMHTCNPWPHTGESQATAGSSPTTSATPTPSASGPNLQPSAISSSIINLDAVPSFKSNCPVSHSIPVTLEQSTQPSAAPGASSPVVQPSMGRSNVPLAPPAQKPAGAASSSAAGSAVAPLLIATPAPVPCISSVFVVNGTVSQAISVPASSSSPPSQIPPIPLPPTQPSSSARPYTTIPGPPSRSDCTWVSERSMQTCFPWPPHANGTQSAPSSSTTSGNIRVQNAPVSFSLLPKETSVPYDRRGWVTSVKNRGREEGWRRM